MLLPSAMLRTPERGRPLKRACLLDDGGRRSFRTVIEENAVTRGDFDSDRATGGSSGAARKSKAAKSEAAKRDAAEAIEGSTDKKSVPPGRGRMKGRAVSPQLKSPDVHLELMRLLRPEPPRHGSAPTPALFLPSGVRYARHTGRSLCSFWQHRSWQQRLPAKSDAAKRYTADAREGSTGMTAVLHPKGRKRAGVGPLKTSCRGGSGCSDLINSR